jgi:hypothetical protein
MLRWRNLRILVLRVGPIVILVIVSVLVMLQTAR